MTSKAQSEVFRPIATFSKNIWKDQFPCFPPSNLAQEFDLLTKEIEPLKEKVRDMLTASTADALEKVKFIDTLLRLDVSYHFEKDIKQQLERIFYSQKVVVNGNQNHDYDLNSTSILFRVLRQHGFKMSCSVFEKFKDKDGKFKESLIDDDVRGMVSLYEAAYLRVHGESILEEALAFTKAHLKSLAMKSKPHLAKQITDALDHPLNKCPPRLAARNYIPFCEEESRNETLLRFEKLDFNRLQLLHKQEICQMARFWNDYNFSSKLPYARERYVECYLWMGSLRVEPRYARWRIILSKMVLLISIIDDTTDAYGTPQEVKSFIDAVKRWDIDAIDELQDNIKVICKAVLDLFSEIDEEARKEGISYAAPYAKDAFIRQIVRYQIENKWSHGDYVPTLEEYNNIALKTTGYDALIAISFMGLGQIAEAEAFEWLQRDPKIMESINIIGRFMNDIVSHEFERMREHSPSCVECYMKQHNVTEKDAVKELEKMIEDAWKDINGECMRPTAVPRDLLSLPLNLARVTHLFYKHADGHTHPEYLKDDIRALFLDPIPL